jgi:dimethylglycine dehydrogenase
MIDGETDRVTAMDAARFGDWITPGLHAPKSGKLPTSARSLPNEELPAARPHRTPMYDIFTDLGAVCDLSFRCSGCCSASGDEPTFEYPSFRRSRNAFGAAKSKIAILRRNQ